jgi:hypothetical protein
MGRWTQVCLCIAAPSLRCINNKFYDVVEYMAAMSLEYERSKSRHEDLRMLDTKEASHA